MKILFLSAANSTHTVKWVNALAERGHEVHLVFNKDHSPIYNQIDESVQLHPLNYGGAKGYYLNSLQLNRITKNIRPDVINVHYASGYGTLARWSRIPPYLLSVWGSDVYEFPYRSKINNYILKKNIKHAKMLASTSECMAEQLKNVVGDSTLDIAITPFGVDLHQFSGKGSKKKTNNEIIIGNIKSLKRVYRIDILIQAIRILKDAFKLENKQDIANRLKVYIYGDGELKESLRELIEELNLGRTVFLRGWIPNTEVSSVLQQFDIFCATSESESFGVAVVEAMAMEKPVVVSDAQGFQEVVQDGVTGFIAAGGTPEKIAEYLKRLILDEDLRKQMGTAGRVRVEKFYDWNKNVSTMERIYQELKEEI